MGWPPKDGFVRQLRHVNITRPEPTVVEWDEHYTVDMKDAMRESAYVNVATRMLGMNKFAYTGAARPDD